MSDSNLVAPHLTVVLVHPSRLHTEGLASLLKETQYKKIYQASSFENCSLDYDHQGKIVFIVGGRAASEIVETVKNIRSRLQSAYILVVNASTDPRDVMTALEAGADGYLRDAISSQTLIRVIELVIEDETILPPEFVKSLRDQRGAQGNTVRSSDNEVENKEESDSHGNGELSTNVKLSAREGSILKGLIDGASNKVIAQRLHITEATVKVHVKAILRKIRVKNRTQAAMWAAQHIASSEALSANRDSPLYIQLR